MFSLKNEALWIKITLLLTIICIVTAFLYCIFSYNSAYFIMGQLEKGDNDDVRYIRTAMVLLDKGMLVDYDVNAPTVAEMPGHALILAGLFKLFGMWGGITAFRVFQMILQVLCLIILFFLGRAIFGSKVAIIACMIDALYLPEIVSTTFILTELEFKFLLMLLIYISIYAVRTHKMKYYIIGAVIWGLSCYIRPTTATFPIVIFIMWLIYKYTFKEMLRFGSVTVLIFCALLSPWWIRNYLVFDRFIPMTMASGNPFLQGTYINYDQTKDYTNYSLGKDAIENDKIEMETGKYRLKKYFKKDPVKYILWYVFGKTWRLWSHPFYWRAILGIDGMHVLKYHLGILVTAFLGIFQVFRRKNKDGIYLVVIIIYFNVIHIPYFTFSRYAYPVMPLVILMSAVFIVSLQFLIKKIAGFKEKIKAIA